MNLPERPRVLVVGKDARTEAMTNSLALSARRPELIGMSEFRSPGMLAHCREIYSDVSLLDVAHMLEIATQVQPDLAVIGPEEPLAMGLVDRLEDDLGVPCFGPRQELARIETSKSWARQLLSRHNIAGNPRHEVIHDASRLSEVIELFGEYVIKPDGLTGGKGVKLSGDHFADNSEAVEYAADLIEQDGVVVGPCSDTWSFEEVSSGEIGHGDSVIPR